MKQEKREEEIQFMSLDHRHICHCNIEERVRLREGFKQIEASNSNDDNYDQAVGL